MSLPSNQGFNEIQQIMTHLQGQRHQLVHVSRFDMGAGRGKDLVNGRDTLRGGLVALGLDHLADSHHQRHDLLFRQAANLPFQHIQTRNEVRHQSRFPFSITDRWPS